MSRRKEVHWHLTVDQYSSYDSPESWTSELPANHVPHTPPPPPPRPNQNLPLPGAFSIHPSLMPELALKLDFSFPSAAFRANPQLTRTLLNEPACHPPQSMLYLRISAGHYQANFDVRNPQHGQVTVGDVLTVIQHRLRQYDHGNAPREAAPYKDRRIATVNGYCSIRDRATIEAERRAGGRFVDHLLGHTLFAGLTPQLGQRDNCLQVELAIPARYAY
ncbi:hypothetical protein DFH06DRAFT_391738 [Mycena polygramma]|nr:hypothetical protein DFH06DRAFT_391738 [Mycena polygramma]